MNETDYSFEVYKQYLIQIANKESRPFRLPKTNISLLERTDQSFFFVLMKKLTSKGIKNKKQIAVFMESARKYLPTFHISDVVDNFESIWENYKAVKEDSVDEAKIKIKKAFEYLKEYSIINGIESYEDLLKGSPPVLLKLWKRGSVDERVLVSLFDFETVKRKPWYRIYCGDLVPKLKRINNEIKNSVDLVSLIETELVKFKGYFGNR